MTLALVARPVCICAAWHVREVPDDQHPIGSQCDQCGRDVALPRSLPNARPICLYCGIDMGLVPLVEVEPDEESSPYGLLEPIGPNRTTALYPFLSCSATLP